MTTHLSTVLFYDNFVHVLLDGTTRFSVQKDGKTVPPPPPPPPPPPLLLLLLLA
jgi:hypothetical protein